VGKVKIYKYAREKGIPSKTIVEKLKAAGHTAVKNQMSTIEESILLEVMSQNTPLATKPTARNSKVAPETPKTGGTGYRSNPSANYKGSSPRPSTGTPRPKSGGGVMYKSTTQQGTKPAINIDKTLTTINSDNKPATSKNSAKVHTKKPVVKKDYSRKAPVVKVEEEPVKTKTEIKKERRTEREQELKSQSKIAY